MKDVLYQFNPWWETSFKTETMNRDRYIRQLKAEMDTRDIVFLTGLRRVGKTTIMHQLIEHLLENTDASKILYTSLEHPQFLRYTLLDILKEYRSAHGLERKEKVYLFFDEIHMKEGFERDLKVLYDMENVKIFVSGSSSLVMRHDGSFLTGRYRRIGVEPFSFTEFLRFKGLNIKESEAYLYETHLHDYMKTGGMPEYVQRRDPKYLLEMMESIIYKDIVARYHLRNPEVLKTLLLLLAERVGKKTTYNKLSKILGVASDTVKQYISYFEETFLLYQVPKCARSLNERVYSPKKIYFADVGMKNVITGFKDIGSVAENLVFLKLKQEGDVCYSYSNGREVDFIQGDTAIEVKFKEDIEHRELDALQGAETKRKLLISKKQERIPGIESISLSDFLKA